jgi:hypothetical protein
METQRPSRRTFIKTTALALPFIASGCANFSKRKNCANDFVSVRNGQFQLRGRPYFYVGTNLWFGCYVCDPDLAGGRKRFVRELDQLQKIGATNIRLLAGSETSPLVGAIPRRATTTKIFCAAWIFASPKWRSAICARFYFCQIIGSGAEVSRNTFAGSRVKIFLIPINR